VTTTQVSDRSSGSGPLQHRDFRWLLSGAAVSQVGTQVTLVALPLIAVVVLRAPAFQVGLLTAAETAAFLLIGLPAGAWVDRIAAAAGADAGRMWCGRWRWAVCRSPPPSTC